MRPDNLIFSHLEKKACPAKIFRLKVFEVSENNP